MSGKFNNTQWVLVIPHYPLVIHIFSPLITRSSPTLLALVFNAFENEFIIYFFVCYFLNRMKTHRQRLIHQKLQLCRHKQYNRQPMSEPETAFSVHLNQSCWVLDVIVNLAKVNLSTIVPWYPTLFKVCQISNTHLFTRHSHVCLNCNSTQNTATVNRTG